MMEPITTQQDLAQASEKNKKKIIEKASKTPHQEIHGPTPADQANALTPEQSQVENLASPLAIQLAFAQTVAPLLEMISGQGSKLADQYGGIMGGLAKNLPPAYKAVAQSQIPQTANLMKYTSSENEVGAILGPALDALMQQVQQAGALQKLSQYESERAIANQVAPAVSLAMGLLPGAGGTAGATPTAGATGATVPGSVSPVAGTAVGAGAYTPQQIAQLNALGIHIPGIN